MSDNEIINLPIAEQMQVEVYDRITDPLTAIKTLGGAIFKSGIFGVDKIEQGEILAMECLAQRKSPLELARTYHFIQGQLAIRTDALLAKFHLAGGTVEWITRTDDLVEAVFTRGKSNARITASMKEYTDNGTSLGRDGKLKENWKRWPRRMLTARAISEGVRLIAPECCFGTYVSEEIDVQPAKPAARRLADLIPAGKMDKAIEVLVKTGHLLAGDTIEQLSPDTEESSLKKPAAFLEALN